MNIYECVNCGHIEKLNTKWRCIECPRCDKVMKLVKEEGKKDLCERRKDG